MAEAETVKVTARMGKALYDALIGLAEKRGVSANTVLQQAIVNEAFIADQTADGSIVLVEKPDRTFRKLTLSGH